MSEMMINRVATVLADMVNSHDWERYIDNAFAIVRDMHEPTPNMVKAGEGKVGVDSWKAMIDAALAEQLGR